MNRLFTTLLLWLMMAAIPLHAVAAGFSMSCTPVRHAIDAPPLGGHADHPAAGDAVAHHDGHHADTAGVADAADVAEAPAADGGCAAGDTGKLPHSSCSACSVFCVGAVAPPASSFSLPSFDGSEAVASAPADPVTGFIPDGLQRPPRQ